MHDKTNNDWPAGTKFKYNSPLLQVEVPFSESMKLRPEYTPEGFQPATIKITANGNGDTCRAEEIAWEDYLIFSSCEHEFHRLKSSFGFDLLFGDAECSKCYVKSKQHFMEDVLYRSMEFASIAHKGQKRKFSGEPYIIHPEAVFRRIQWMNRDITWEHRVQLGCAAWLHDVLEDCPEVTSQQIEEIAGSKVLSLVEELTNPSKQRPDLNRAARKKIDCEHLQHVSWDAKIIKLYDRIVNLSDLWRENSNGFAQVYARESLQLYEVLKDADVQLAKELLKWIKEIEKKNH